MISDSYLKSYNCAYIFGFFILGKVFSSIKKIYKEGTRTDQSLKLIVNFVTV